MEVSLWQGRARIVAYIDMVLSTLALIAAVLMIALGVTATAIVVTHKDEIKDEMAKEDIPEGSLSVFIIALWIGAAIMAIIVAIDMWAAVMLLKATKPGVEPQQALDRARIWRNVAIVFLIFAIIFKGASQSYISLAIEILFRMILLYVVIKFISALERSIGTTQYASPDGVMIKQ